jgi:hypothetical protein
VEDLEALMVSEEDSITRIVIRCPTSGKKKLTATNSMNCLVLIKKQQPNKFVRPLEKKL